MRPFLLSAVVVLVLGSLRLWIGVEGRAPEGRIVITGLVRAAPSAPSPVQVGFRAEATGVRRAIQTFVVRLDRLSEISRHFEPQLERIYDWMDPPIHNALVGADGHFELGPLPPTSYVASTGEWERLDVAYWVGAPSGVFEAMRPSRSRDPIYVFDRETRKPVEGARVRVTCEVVPWAKHRTLTTVIPPQEALVPRSGHADFDLPGQGRCTAHASAAGYEDAELEVKSGCEMPDLVLRKRELGSAGSAE